MEKKKFNVYEAPAVEVVEVKMQGIVCASLTEQEWGPGTVGGDEV